MLEGLKVVELATYIAAPGAACVLADWGAEVVKVEPPGGDPIRKFFVSIAHETEDNPVFELDNRGKKGLALDISNPAGREVLLRLLSQADVFLTNVRPSGLSRAGLDYETLSKTLPRLIYASVTGYGLQGPDVDRPGFDVAAFWSRSGIAALTAPRGEEPFPLRTGMGDHVTSLATVGAILAAVVERSKSGKGRLVETSLLRTGVYAIGSDLAIQMRFGRVASNRRRSEAVSPLGNFFKTRDGCWICLVPRQGADEFKPLVRTLNRAALADDERFQTARSRREHVGALVAELDAAFAEFDFEEAARRLDAIDMAFAPVQRPAEICADPQAEAAGCFVEMTDARGGATRGPASPARFDGAAEVRRPPAPGLGEHNLEILETLGYGREDGERLRREGAFG